MMLVLLKYDYLWHRVLLLYQVEEILRLIRLQEVKLHIEYSLEGGKSLFKIVRSHDQDGRHLYIW